MTTTSVRPGFALVAVAVLSAGCLGVTVPDTGAFGAASTPTPTPAADQLDGYRIAGDSMEPTLSDGDIIHVNRSAEPEPGAVITFQTADRGTVITHRAAFRVDAGENWYDRADPAYLPPVDGCSELPMCPAPNAGWLTRGDNVSAYDQAELRDPEYPVSPDRVIGVVPDL